MFPSLVKVLLFLGGHAKPHAKPPAQHHSLPLGSSVSRFLRHRAVQAKRVQRRKSFSAFRCAIFSLSISLSESLVKKAMPTLFAS